MLTWLHLKLNAQGLIDLNTWCTDSTVMRATRASAGAGKKGQRTKTKPGRVDDENSHIQ